MHLPRLAALGDSRRCGARSTLLLCPQQGTLPRKAEAGLSPLLSRAGGGRGVRCEPSADQSRHKCGTDAEMEASQRTLESGGSAHAGFGVGPSEKSRSVLS